MKTLISQTFSTSILVICTNIIPSVTSLIRHNDNEKVWGDGMICGLFFSISVS